MKLPVVAKQEMSHPIIHHFKKANTVQSCTSKYCQFHRSSQQEYTSNFSYCGVVTDSAPGNCSGAAWDQVKTASLQLLCEVISSCQTRNVASHVNFIMNYRPNISSRRWIAHILIWKTKSSKAASQQMQQYMWYVHPVTSTSANATMMKLPVVAKQEMSHPIIHHFKKADTIQPCTSTY